MISIETLAIFFATLGALIGAGCVALALLTLFGAKTMSRQKILDAKQASAIDFSRVLIDTWERRSSDLPQADRIEITIAEQPDGTTQLWINVDGANAFRAYKVKNLIIDDRRDWSMEAALKTAE